jgi:flagellar hook-associated protein 2
LEDRQIMSMSVDGLISGMDTTTLISQLMQAEAGPQTALKTRLKSTELAASAYRTVNSTFATLRSAAEAVLKADSWTPVKASASSSAVAATASNGATTGSLTFAVKSTATAHAVVSPVNWAAPTDAHGLTSPLEVRDENGVAVGTITITGSTPNDAVNAINASEFKLSAAAVKVGEGQYRLQVAAKETGAAAAFDLGTLGTFTATTVGKNAVLTVGTDSTYEVSSATNTFDGLLPGVTITANKQDPLAPITVSVNADPDAVATKVQALVDAVNSAITNVKTYTNNSKGSTAALRGDYAVGQLGGQLLDAVSFAVGSDGSPAQVGFQLSRDGKVTFDKGKFLTALSADPALAQRMVAGTAASTGIDGIAGTADDVTSSGIAGRLLAVARTASDSATGSLVKLAEGKDSMVKDITDRIAAWDLRLEKRRETLTRQFSAMETALSSLKNQSTWLAGQLNSLS